MLVEDGEQLVDIGLKMSREDSLRLVGHKWELEVSKDLRLPA
jgi:hypothetical protein